MGLSKTITACLIFGGLICLIAAECPNRDFESKHFCQISGKTKCMDAKDAWKFTRKHGGRDSDVKFNTVLMEGLANGTLRFRLKNGECVHKAGRKYPTYQCDIDKETCSSMGECLTFHDPNNGDFLRAEC